jgi:hypothetical protein
LFNGTLDGDSVRRAEIIVCFAIINEQLRNCYEYFKILASTQGSRGHAVGYPGVTFDISVNMIIFLPMLYFLYKF